MIREPLQGGILDHFPHTRKYSAGVVVVLRRWIVLLNTISGMSFETVFNSSLFVNRMKLKYAWPIYEIPDMVLDV